jgi:hypothetical protein
VNLRLLLIALLLLLVVGGLTAGVFAGSIQHALTVPARHVTTVGAAAATPSPATMSNGGAPNTPNGPAAPAMNGQMPATALAQDSFQRQNQPLWGTASDGRAWQGDANNPASARVFAVINNIGVIVGGANQQGTFNALLGPNKDNVDVLLNASISRFTGGDNLGVVVRWTDKNHWYKALIDGSHLVLLKRADQISTRLSTVPFKAQSKVAYSLRLRSVGANLFARAWPTNTPEPNTWMINTVDPALRSGQVGVRVLLQNDTIVNVTSFQATTASTAM